MRIPAFIHPPGTALDAPLPGSWAATTRRWLAHATAGLHRWHDEQRTQDALDRLDRRMLRDIGLDGVELRDRLLQQR